MKKFIFSLTITMLFMLAVQQLQAQCSICTKTASQLGEKAGLGLNTGILYLMVTPFAIGGFIGYRWWKTEKNLKEQEAGND